LRSKTEIADVIFESQEDERSPRDSAHGLSVNS